MPLKKCSKTARGNKDTTGEVTSQKPVERSQTALERSQTSVEATKQPMEEALLVPKGQVAYSTAKVIGCVGVNPDPTGVVTAASRINFKIKLRGPSVL